MLLLFNHLLNVLFARAKGNNRRCFCFQMCNFCFQFLGGKISSDKNYRAQLQCGQTYKPTLMFSFFFSNSIIILLLSQHFSNPSHKPRICNGKHYPQQKCAVFGGKIGEGVRGSDAQSRSEQQRTTRDQGASWQPAEDQTNRRPTTPKATLHTLRATWKAAGELDISGGAQGENTSSTLKSGDSSNTLPPS